MYYGSKIVFRAAMIIWVCSNIGVFFIPDGFVPQPSLLFSACVHLITLGTALIATQKFPRELPSPVTLAYMAAIGFLMTLESISLMYFDRSNRLVCIPDTLVYALRFGDILIVYLYSLIEQYLDGEYFRMYAFLAVTYVPACVGAIMANFPSVLDVSTQGLTALVVWLIVHPIRLQLIKIVQRRLPNNVDFLGFFRDFSAFPFVFYLIAYFTVELPYIVSDPLPEMTYGQWSVFLLRNMSILGVFSIFYASGMVVLILARTAADYHLWSTWRNVFWTLSCMIYFGDTLMQVPTIRSVGMIIFMFSAAPAIANYVFTFCKKGPNFADTMVTNPHLGAGFNLNDLDLELLEDDANNKTDEL